MLHSDDASGDGHHGGLSGSWAVTTRSPCAADTKPRVPTLPLISKDGLKIVSAAAPHPPSSSREHPDTARVRGGFIAPLHVPQSGSLTARFYPASSLVHTSGGITSVHATLLHTPGPGHYTVPAPPPKRQCALPRESRKIMTHSGGVDLFAAWNGLGPGSYFRRLDDYGFAGRERVPIPLKNYRIPPHRPPRGPQR